MTAFTWEKMPLPTSDTESDAMKWIVPARNNIQRELLRLREEMGVYL